MKNLHAIILFVLLISMSTGTIIGGSFQPVRIIIILYFIYFLKAIIKYKASLKSDMPLCFGMFFFILWILYGLISLSWSPSPMSGLTSELIAMMIGFLSLPLLLILSKNVDNLDVVTRKALLVCFLITAILAIYELLTGNHFSDRTERILRGGGEFIDVPFAAVGFGNINNYGLFISFVSPYLLCGILESKTSRVKLIFVLAFMLGFIFIILNGQQLGITVLSLYVLLFILFYIRKVKLKYVIVGLFSVLLLLAILPLEDILVTIRFRLANENIMAISPYNVRLSLSLIGLGMLRDSFGFGVGAGAFEDFIIDNRLYIYTRGIINPHNLFIEILAQYGILIFSLFCFLLIIILFYTKKNKFISPGFKMIVYFTIVSLPFLGLMNSRSLGQTFFWVFINLTIIISVYKPKYYKKS